MDRNSQLLVELVSAVIASRSRARGSDLPLSAILGGSRSPVDEFQTALHATLRPPSPLQRLGAAPKSASARSPLADILSGVLAATIPLPPPTPPLNLGDLYRHARRPTLLTALQGVADPNLYAKPSGMEVHIFDVEHGFCAAVIAPSGRLMLIDCGHNSTTGWRPSAWVAARQQPIANLTITNFDRDHVSDLPNVLARCGVETYTLNWALTGDWVRRAKAENRIDPGVLLAAALLDQNRDAPSVSIDWGGAQVARFYHPPGVFPPNDTNSVSVVTFVHYMGVRIVFPGDLTREAWQLFLQNAAFLGWLRTTNIFVASHHGREDGHCPEVFDVCRPDVIIISDEEVKYDTQIMDYGQHAHGIPWNGTDIRYSLTTRRDGKLTITPMGTQGFWIEAKPTG